MRADCSKVRESLARSGMTLVPSSAAGLLAFATLVFVLSGCATSRPPAAVGDVLNGPASWYGQEFAGRTTANGEIFDPLLLTAAHRTLPFGTVVDVLNTKNGQTVQVRINDRGPFVGNRIIDVSYAAADKLGMVEGGIAAVKLSVVKVGAGDREPRAPYVVTINTPSDRIRDPGTAPSVAFPLPGQQSQVAAEATGDVEISAVTVVEERAGVPMRRQVSADGRTIETVPDPEALGIPAPAPPPPARPVQAPAPSAVRTESSSPRPPRGGFIIQLGAFQNSGNAEDLRRRVAAILPNVYVDQERTLLRVRVGPFASKAAAVDAREKLEASGFSGMIVNN